MKTKILLTLTQNQNNMKRLFLVFTILFCITLANAQNPFEAYGYTPKIATLSNGKYNEFHDLDTVVQIGTVLFNTQTKQIVAFLQVDTLYSEATLQPDIVSMWMSPDPLASEYPSNSLYIYCLGNPIVFVDPDGRFVDWFENEKTGQIINVKGTSQLPADEQNKGWVNIGKDEMFGKSNVPAGQTGNVTKMNESESVSFMSKQGYKLTEKQLFVYDKSANEKIPAGPYSNSLITGELIKIGEKKTYVLKNHVIQNESRTQLEKPREYFSKSGFPGLIYMHRSTLTYGTPREKSFWEGLFGLTGNLTTDSRSTQYYPTWNMYPKGKNTFIDKHRP